MVKAIKYRDDFPCLDNKIKGNFPIYFDNACMSLKPKSVISAIVAFYEGHPSCHNRAVHKFGKMTTDKYNAARDTVKDHFNCEKEEVVFVRNTTEAINLVANTYPFKSGDVVVTSDFEHNSNLLPWQFLSNKKEIQHHTFSIPPYQHFDNLDDYRALFKNSNVKMVSTFYTSHVTGVTLPIKEMVKIAHEHGALFFLDAAQGVPHSQIDFKNIDVDLLAFSFHKAYGPSGMGGLLGKMEVLEQLTPFLVGGETVQDSHYDSCILAPIPERFEAGLQNYSGVFGGAKALSYVQSIGYSEISSIEKELNAFATEELMKLPRVKILGPKDAFLRGSILNFEIENIDSGELSILLDRTKNIMTRSGVHCCHAWFHKYNLKPTLRVSFALYNTVSEVETFIKVIKDFVKYY